MPCETFTFKNVAVALPVFDDKAAAVFCLARAQLLPHILCFLCFDIVQNVISL